MRLTSPASLTFLVEGGGFEPPKAEPADLQSAPFGHSGTPPDTLLGAGDGTRTRNLLITNQLLYRLSYSSPFVRTNSLRRKCLYLKDHTKVKG